jgi:transcriptional regulator with XRE-family HTH domain
MIFMTICPGARIKELRLLYGLPQEELGSKVGLQRAAIQKYEKGTVENIPLKTIEKIAEVFDVSPSYIVGWNGKESNQLAAEVKVLQGVQKFYGNGCVNLIEYYIHLNDTGKERVSQYIEDMNRIYEDA